ncbi:3-hydroxyacyl-CoA dehydrogenase family protein [Brevibacillus brevis]|uniref:3-hydroxyacyl-CoA dehydrogenase family protein n=1 Tax=Brevibacillus brevis TaxID=1393 RepID=A0ABY9SWV4_BREBE|nr:3-hydroxyacyl-CoA dehydrogenase family protein [Brevibacillus brevis]WNC12307.1 3-hydroxyacyl-CoA dehydrogenase family protein [Brevibacillus brevis]
MKVTVIGSGIMGSGIAQVCAMEKLSVSIFDINEEQIEKALVTMKTSLGRFEKKGRLSESIETIMDRINISVSLKEAVQGSSLVIEAAVEDLKVKQNIFRELDGLTSDDVVLGTNTSQVSITSIASVVKNPGRVIGIHFFNPAPMMNLIEIIRGLETTDETLQKVQEFSKMVNKETVVCKKDRNGFLTSRLILAFRAEAIRMLEEGVGTVEDIDKACRLGFNHPMGPFELNDFNGLDLGYKAFKSMEEVYGERFKVPQLLENMVNANRLGRKTGKGWYDYE